ncbi:MAG: cupin domain-containing protein [Acidobacteriota bacterium]
MRRMIWVLALCVSGIGLQAQSGEKVTFIGHDTVAQGGTLVTAPNLIVQVNKRTETGMSELHDKETDTFYILSGAATFVTGGEMIESKLTAPGQYRGTGLRGGDTHQLAKGDVLVIPARTPHWFKDVSGSIEYYVVKVVAP